MYETRSDACRAFLEARKELGKQSVTEAVALADTDRLKQFVEGNSDVIMVGTAQCYTEWVVHVGVRQRDVQIPKSGEGGTPVLVFHQREFSALG